MKNENNYLVKKFSNLEQKYSICENFNKELKQKNKEIQLIISPVEENRKLNNLNNNNNKIEDKSDENNEDKNESKKSGIKENSYYFINASNQDLVYFYRTPNEYDRKNSYFNSKEQVFVGEIKDNFGYIEFTNSKGEISKGWIRLNDLTIN